MSQYNIPQLVYKTLKDAKINVFFAGQHSGDVTQPYVAVKMSTSSQYLNYSSNIDYINLYCYVPKNQYSQLCNYVAEIEQALIDRLYPTVKCLNERTEPFFDDTCKGWMQRTMFRNIRKVDSDLFRQTINEEE